MPERFNDLARERAQPQANLKALLDIKAVFLTKLNER